MTSGAFEIGIIKQAWIDPKLELDEAPNDLCSHGDIRLEIGGQVIVSSEAEPGEEVADWWTINTSALALLRTLESDHLPPDRRVADRLILHCGMIEMMNCGIGVDWSVRHLGGRVQLADVVRYDTTNEAKGVVRFPGLVVEVREDEYRRAVAAFAEEAKQLFVGREKTPSDEYEQQVYEEFWREYDERLNRARSPFAE